MTDEDWLPSKRKNQVNLNRKTKELYESMGWVVVGTQHHDRMSQRSHDLMGFGDHMMWFPGSDQVVVAQTTDSGHASNRLRKILKSELAYLWLKESKSRHIWLVVWKKILSDVQDKTGRVSRREIWASEPRMIVEGDFKLCHGNRSMDALSLDVPRGQREVVTEDARSMVESSSVGDGEKNPRRNHLTLSIVRKRGEP